MSITSDLALANRLADAAGEAIRPLFRSNWAHEAKADASPVTEADRAAEAAMRSEEHTSELQSLMRISYAVFCLKKKKRNEPILKNKTFSVIQHTNQKTLFTLC